MNKLALSPIRETEELMAPDSLPIRCKDCGEHLQSSRVGRHYCHSQRERRTGHLPSDDSRLRQNELVFRPDTLQTPKWPSPSRTKNETWFNNMKERTFGSSRSDLPVDGVSYLQKGRKIPPITTSNLTGREMKETLPRSAGAVSSSYKNQEDDTERVDRLRTRTMSLSAGTPSAGSRFKTATPTWHRTLNTSPSPPLKKEESYLLEKRPSLTEESNKGDIHSTFFMKHRKSVPTWHRQARTLPKKEPNSQNWQHGTRELPQTMPSWKSRTLPRLLHTVPREQPIAKDGNARTRASSQPQFSKMLNSSPRFSRSMMRRLNSYTYNGSGSDVPTNANTLTGEVSSDPLKNRTQSKHLSDAMDWKRIKSFQRDELQTMRDHICTPNDASDPITFKRRPSPESSGPSNVLTFDSVLKAEQKRVADERMRMHTAPEMRELGARTRSQQRNLSPQDMNMNSMLDEIEEMLNDSKMRNSSVSKREHSIVGFGRKPSPPPPPRSTRLINRIQTMQNKGNHLTVDSLDDMERSNAHNSTSPVSTDCSSCSDELVACHGCHGTISTLFEKHLEAAGGFYHVECFKCEVCGQHIAPEDPFWTDQSQDGGRNIILCKDDFTRLVRDSRRNFQ